MRNGHNTSLLWKCSQYPPRSVPNHENRDMEQHATRLLNGQGRARKAGVPGHSCDDRRPHNDAESVSGHRRHAQYVTPCPCGVDINPTRPASSSTAGVMPWCETCVCGSAGLSASCLFQEVLMGRIILLLAFALVIGGGVVATAAQDQTESQTDDVEIEAAPAFGCATPVDATSATPFATPRPELVATPGASPDATIEGLEDVDLCATPEVGTPPSS